jgi:hypothetical protein
MATTLTTATRNAAADAIADLVDVGATDANGDLVIMAAADAEVAILAMTNPAFGNAGASNPGECIAATISDDTNATGGTAIAFKLQNRDNTEVIRGGVATSGSELNLSSTTIAASDTVSVSALTLTVPAS